MFVGTFTECAGLSVPRRRTFAADILSSALSDADCTPQSWLRLSAYAGSRGTANPAPSPMKKPEGPGNAPGDQQQFAVGPGGSLVTYSRLGAFDSSLSVTKSVVSQSVGAVNGQITQFVVVPEPATLLLAGVGTALLGWRILRRRRAA